MALLVFASQALPRTLSVAVTLPDVLPIVQAVGGAQVQAFCVAPGGADPHSFTLSAQTAQALHRSDLIVFVGTPFLEFEAQIKRAVPQVPCTDWPDYVAHGARLNDVPGLPANPHGVWMDLDNGIAIAQALGSRLKALGLAAEAVDGNVRHFVAEVRAAQETGKALARQMGTGGQTLVAVVPGVADCILNLGMKVGKVLLPTEGASFASVQDVEETVTRLRSGEWRGLVCPLNAAEAKPGEIARQVARDAGSHVMYVRFLDASGEEPSYLAQAYYNAAVLAAGLARAGDKPPREAPCTGAVVLGVAAPLGLVIIVLVAAPWRARMAARTALPGAGIFEGLEEGQE